MIKIKKTCCIVVRAYKGELPYIHAFVEYYINHMKADHIFIISTDGTDFNKKLSNYLDKITFSYFTSKTSKQLRSAVCDFKLSEIYDYVLFVDVDEFLYLHSKSLPEFIADCPYDYYRFKWLMCLSTKTNHKSIKEIIKSNSFSIGHAGKVMAKTSMIDNISSEHDVKTNNNAKKITFDSKFKENPFIIHVTARGLEDLMIKGCMQVIKEELKKNNYTKCLTQTPKHFEDLPVRFRLAYFQLHLPKIKIDVNFPELEIDQLEIKKLFRKYKITLSNTRLFDENYNIENYISLYNKGCLEEVNFVEFIKRTCNSKLSDNM